MSMLIAGFWGFVGGAALLLGALAGIYARISTRIVGLVMAFGAGVLVSAVAFELTEEAYRASSGGPVVAGLVSGSLVFFAGDWWVDSRGANRRKSQHGEDHEGTDGSALALGALLDGIPESAAIGTSLLAGGKVSVAMVAAVFLSNIPEALSASTGMKKGGRSTSSILWLWGAVVAASTLAAALGYGLLGGAGPVATAVIQAFAAGAIITMLADTMMPEAVEHAGRWVGLLTMLGFALAFLLSTAE